MSALPIADHATGISLDACARLMRGRAIAKKNMAGNGPGHVERIDACRG